MIGATLILMACQLVGLVMLSGGLYRAIQRLGRPRCPCGWRARARAKWCAACGRNLADPSRRRAVTASPA